MLKIFFFVFYKIAIQFCGNAKQNPGCIAVTAIQNFKSIFSLVSRLVGWLDSGVPTPIRHHSLMLPL